ncbi:MAG: hypothetical protein AVDCRST_MAG19-1817 [uncultured Thermomicrobiales bacterium]|uniref:Uncharacterized protein n=1 Tax=uncultured Thermomicrobiales bacterium TaxID=1645740 RepID=A0A6J4UVS1_9BACT|nr:MAG: hypothetical protein AVDCRST_MAG19-1817 [uncultured Thermomicrobiales bacterium]
MEFTFDHGSVVTPGRTSPRLRPLGPAPTPAPSPPPSRTS